MGRAKNISWKCYVCLPLSETILWILMKFGNAVIMEEI
jgi:hypothetical protein